MFKGITKGADLTKPKLSGGYIVNGIVAVIVLMAVIAAAAWIYGKTIGKAVSGIPAATTAGINQLAPGTFGDGS